MTTNLHRRGATYYVRVATPTTLQDLRQSRSGHRGSREVLRSLRTKDFSAARGRALEELVRIRRSFQAEEAALRAAGIPALTTPSDQDFQAAAFEFRAAELLEDERERLYRPSRGDVERKRGLVRAELEANPQWTVLDALTKSDLLRLDSMAQSCETAAERRAHLADALRQSLGENEFHLVDWAIQAAMRSHNWRIEPGGAAYKKLGRQLLKAWLNVLGAADARDRGVYDSQDDVIVHISKARETQRGERTEGIRHYFGLYLTERHQGLGKSALKDRWATIRQFAQNAGDKPVTEYRKADLMAYKGLLSHLPARTEKLYPGLPLTKAVERNRNDGHPTLKAASIRNKLSTISAFGTWLAENVDGVDAGNFKVSLPPRIDSARMEPFTDAQVTAILNARAFVGCESEKNQLDPGRHRVRDWRFWLPMILAFTGARLNEVVQLRVQDIRQVEGLWIFAFTGEGVGQSLKTASSRRVLPVHPQLLGLGLMEFVQDAAAAGQADLFYKVSLDADGRHSTRAGKWFRKFLARIGVKGSDLGGAHRWRHTLADALRKGGVQDFDIGRLLGHDVNVARMTGHYGREVDLSVKQKHALISKATYPTVDFELLKT